MSGAYAPPSVGSTTSNQNLVNVSFGYGDASPKIIYQVPAGQSKLITTAQIVLTQAFNASGTSLELGDTGQSDRLISSSSIDTTYAAEYETNPAHVYSAGSIILLTIAPGSATQGAGYVLIEMIDV
jgi:hypothetical protein